jgi:hypothetical protein
LSDRSKAGKKAVKWLSGVSRATNNDERPILLHYGELDVPGPENFSAALNASVPIALEELRAVYRQFGVEDHVQLRVSPGQGHEMDIQMILRFLAGQA